MDNIFDSNFPQRLNKEVFFRLFSEMTHGNISEATSNGKRVMMLPGLCHGSKSGRHSVIFDYTDQLKCYCFSGCGQSFYWWNYIARAKGITSYEAKELILSWLDGHGINLSSGNFIEYDGVFENKAYEPEHIEPLTPMTEEELAEVWQTADGSLDTLRGLVWSTKDKIRPSILQKFGVKFDTKTKGILLPHHNVNGDIVGIYLRSFLPLRREIQEKDPDISYKELIKFPRAKYVPLVKSAARQTDEKSSWSFPNSKNLYGLCFAKEAIKTSRKAIIFEGAKSVMLAHQYGYPFAVASHTYGANINHISMLIEAGAEEIIFAFDRQYQDLNSKEFSLYDIKTKGLADKVKKYVNTSRIASLNNEIGYKDAPIDKGITVFERLYKARERLAWNGELLAEPQRQKDELPVRQNKFDREDFSNYDIRII